MTAPVPDSSIINPQMLVDAIREAQARLVTEVDTRYQQRFVEQEQALAEARAVIERLMAETDRRYDERWQAQEKALETARVTHAAFLTEIRQTVHVRFTDLEAQIHEKGDRLVGLLTAHAIRDDDRFNTLVRSIAEQVGALAVSSTHRFDEVQRAGDLALANQKEAVEKVEKANERRFEAVNEFRATLADQQRTLMPRGEVQALIAANAEKIDQLNTRVDKAEGRGDGGAATRNAIYATVATLVAVVGIILAIYSNTTRHGG